MNATNLLALTLPVFCAGALNLSAALGEYSRLPTTSPEFSRDLRAARTQVDELRSAEPLLALLRKSTNTSEKAVLELEIGLAYGQTTGVVDPAKAVEHLTEALRYDRDDKTYIEIMMWRGNSQEQQGMGRSALKDYLRGLLACSYYDFSGGWPKDDTSEYWTPFIARDPEGREKSRDYMAYRKTIDFRRFLFQQRYSFIRAVKRVTEEHSGTSPEIPKLLEQLSPDASRFGIVLDWLKGENKRPW